MNISELTLDVRLTGCDDDAFTSWAQSGLIWLPERGMGFLRVTEAPYDADYFAKYQRYAATHLGQALTRERLALVQRHAPECGLLIDVGIGCGQFVAAARQAGVEAQGWDVMPEAVEWLERNGICLDPRRTFADALTFWDSLEHIPDAAVLLASAREWVFCSLPIVPGDGPPPRDWKHLRRDEHCWYFTRAGLLEWMAAQGFVCVECNAAESLLGRDDIESFAFRRVV